MAEINLQIKSNRLSVESVEEKTTLGELREELSGEGYDVNNADAFIFCKDGNIITGEIDSVVVRDGDFVKFDTLDIATPLDEIFNGEDEAEDDDEEEGSVEEEKMLQVTLITPKDRTCTFFAFDGYTLGDVLCATTVQELFGDTELCSKLLTFNNTEVPSALKEAFENMLVSDGDVIGLSAELPYPEMRREEKEEKKPKKFIITVE